MTDQEFMDTFISERMQMHYSKRYPHLTADALATALQLESEYNHALETLPPKTASAIRKFHESISDKLTDDGIFSYLRGIKDGLLLYRALKEL